MNRIKARICRGMHEMYTGCTFHQRIFNSKTENSQVHDMASGSCAAKEAKSKVNAVLIKKSNNIPSSNIHTCFLLNFFCSAGCD